MDRIRRPGSYNPSTYDLVINTDILDIADAVELAKLGYGKKRKYLFRQELFGLRNHCFKPV